VHHHGSADDRSFPVESGNLVDYAHLSCSSEISSQIAQIARMPVDAFESSVGFSVGVVMRSCGLAAIGQVSEFVDVHAVERELPESSH
jgi:hypothetical protein